MLYDIARDNVAKLKTIKHAFSMFYTRIKHGFSKNQSARRVPSISLEIVFTIAAPAFDILFIGCVLNKKIAYTTAKKLMFEAFY